MTRFSNTMAALKACIDHLDDDLSEEENKARCQLLILCVEITKGLNKLVEENTELFECQEGEPE